MKKVYACDACRFLFEAEAFHKQCPDCGKFSVREAKEQEIQEFREREEEVWGDADEARR